MMNNKYTVQRGFSLITAIFLLVILAGLGVVMVTFFTAQQQSSTLDVLGARAFQASRAGIEWGSFQVLRNPGVGFELACLPGPTVAFPVLGGTLGGFTVAVTCNSVPAQENAIPVRIYQLVSVATTTAFVAGDPNFVERQITAIIER